MDSNHRLSFPECIDSNISATIKRLLNCYEKFLSRDLSHSSVSTKRPEAFLYIFLRHLHWLQLIHSELQLHKDSVIIDFEKRLSKKGKIIHVQPPRFSVKNVENIVPVIILFIISTQYIFKLKKRLFVCKFNCYHRK